MNTGRQMGFILASMALGSGLLALGGVVFDYPPTANPEPHPPAAAAHSGGVRRYCDPAARVVCWVADAGISCLPYASAAPSVCAGAPRAEAP